MHGMPSAWMHVHCHIRMPSAWMRVLGSVHPNMAVRASLLWQGSVHTLEQREARPGEQCGQRCAHVPLFGADPLQPSA